MNRLTSDNTSEMNMYQLALNQVYIGADGWAWYIKAPDEECRVCDLIRTAAETLGVELPDLSDEDLPGLMTGFLQYGEEVPEGVLAILYRALWAMADVRAKLSRYEDTGLEPEEIPERIVMLPPSCYKEDGDGCAYQAYDGTDEPINECKECPFCCVDKQRQPSKPNTPLTLEELRKMDGDPVFATVGKEPCIELGFWALVEVCGGTGRVWLTDNLGCRTGYDTDAELDNEEILAYRRKPEEGAP